MNAKEARELTAAHTTTESERWLNSALNQIKKECNAGYHSTHFAFLDLKTHHSLQDLGYKVDKDNAGNTVVSWHGDT